MRRSSFKFLESLKSPTRSCSFRPPSPVTTDPCGESRARQRRMATRFFPKPLNRYTSRKGSTGSPSSRALPDQFERETERAQSHLGTYDDGIDKTQRAQVLLQLLVAFGHSSGQRESVRRIISAAKSMLSRNAISRAGEGLPSSADSFRHSKIEAMT
jgi:hypothetical protein